MISSNLIPAAWWEASGYLVVANIPYYITSAVIRHLLEAPAKPARVVLTVQKEVAERICAIPGEMNLLALGVQVYGNPEIKLSIPAAAFYPTPEVDSAVLRIELLPRSSDPHLPAGRILCPGESRVFPEAENLAKFHIGGNEIAHLANGGLTQASRN